MDPREGEGRCGKCGSDRTVAAGVCHAPPGRIVRCEACGHVFLLPTEISDRPPGLCRKCGSPRVRVVGQARRRGDVFFRCDACEHLTIIRRTRPAF
jgi:uncharacterized Zn finger protein